MITQTVTVTEKGSQNIIIGRCGTYDTESVVFDVTYLVDTFGSGTPVLLVKRPNDTVPYPVVTTTDGNLVTWLVDETDTSYKGHGECELFWYVDGGLAKSIIYSIAVLRDIIGQISVEPPDPYQTWVDDLTELGAETLANAQAAAQSASDANGYKYEAYGYARGASESQYYAEQARNQALEAKQGAEAARNEAWEISSHYPTIIDGYWAVWHDGQYWKTSYKAVGVDGRGITDVTGVKTSTSGLVDTYTLTVTYTDGDTDTITFTVTNGRDGTDGTDGVSPGVTIETITGGHRVTITDKDHPSGQSFDVMDGEVSAADLKAVADSKAPVIIDTASGAIASFADGADGMPIKSLVVNIEPQQDLHRQDAPYPAGGGDNKMPAPGTISAPTGLTVTNNNGLLTINGTTTGGTISVDIDPMTFASSGQKIMLFNSFTGGTVYFNYQGTQKEYFSLSQSNRVIPESSLTSLQGQTIDRYRILINAQTLSNATIGIVVCSTSVTPSSFAPYANVCPISGWTGLTVYKTDEDFYSTTGVYAPSKTTIDIVSPDSMRVRGGTSTYPCSIQQLSHYPNLEIGKYYRLSADAEILSGTANIAVRNSQNSRLAMSDEITASGLLSCVFQLTAEMTYISFFCNLNATYGDVTYKNIRFCEVSAIPISWQTEAGTVYGGTDELVSGALVDTMVNKALSSLETWTGSNGSFAVNVSSDAKLPASADDVFNGACSCYKKVSSYSASHHSVDKSIGIATNGYLYVTDSSYATVEDLIAGLSGQYVVYERATPLTYQLDPITISTLYGVNNIFADCGDVACDYPCDTKKYIDKKLAALVAALS